MALTAHQLYRASLESHQYFADFQFRPLQYRRIAKLKPARSGAGSNILQRA
jgi:hypothetical protein